MFKGEVEGDKGEESCSVVSGVAGAQRVLFSSYELHLDSSICSANGCQRTKLCAKVFFFGSLTDPSHHLAGWEVSLSLKVSVQYLLALILNKPVFLSPFLFTFSQGNWMLKTSILHHI